MHKVIEIANVKGGVGKTTTAIHLATALSENFQVEVWDADRQGSASDWAWQAEKNGEALKFPCESVNIAELKRKPANAELTFIDTPPGDPAVLEAATSRCDAVIIPAAPTGGDLSRVFVTLDALPQGLPAVVLMTDADPRTILYRQTLDALNDAEVAVFDQPIKPLQVVRANFNAYPRDLAGYGEVAKELLALMGVSQ